MTIQPSLFGGPPAMPTVADLRSALTAPVPARRDGPDTSRHAARTLDTCASRLRRDALLFVLSRGQHGATFDEWAQARGHPSSQSGRFTELHAAGLIGTTAHKRNTTSGNPARVFVITQAGREALHAREN